MGLVPQWIMPYDSYKVKGDVSIWEQDVTQQYDSKNKDSCIDLWEPAWKELVGKFKEYILAWLMLNIICIERNIC